MRNDKSINGGKGQPQGENKMNEEKVEIKSIKLKLDKDTVTLSIKQARKLKELLNELFGREVVKEEIHHHDYPYYWYPRIWTGTSDINVSYSADNLTLDCSEEVK